MRKAGRTRTRTKTCGDRLMDPLAPHITEIGSLAVRRFLPQKRRRMVGAWCFVDAFGPATFERDKPMDVAPHPHMGLQTVTWLFEGEALHKDSLDSEALARPGALNLMTSGAGIAHSEETPVRNSGQLHGTQLWVALTGVPHGRLLGVRDARAERHEV